MKRWTMIAALLLIPTLGWAQDDTKEKPAEKTDAAKPADAKADDTKKDAAKTDAKADPKKTADAAKADPKKPASGTKGPGGRDLREDYPGNPEAMQPSMETAKIPGLGSGDEKGSKQLYDLRVRELETRIDDLKDKVFRSKSRIVLLKETLLGGKLAGSRSIITHRDNLGGDYEPVRLTYILDTNPIFNELNINNSLTGKKSIELFNASITPGTHTLVVDLQYKGASSVFSYFEGYEFSLKTTCKFVVEEGRATIVDIVPFEGGGITTSKEERPRVKCDITKTDLSLDDVRGTKKKKEEKK